MREGGEEVGAVMGGGGHGAAVPPTQRNDGRQGSCPGGCACGGGGEGQRRAVAERFFGSLATVLELLHEAGADLSLPDGKGHSALRLACLSRNVVAAALLLRFGADVPARRSMGRGGGEGGPRPSTNTRAGCWSPMSRRASCVCSTSRACVIAWTQGTTLGQLQLQRRPCRRASMAAQRGQGRQGLQGLQGHAGRPASRARWARGCGRRTGSWARASSAHLSHAHTLNVFRAN